MVIFYDVLVRFALLFYSYRLRLRLDSRFCFVGWRVLQLYLYRTFSVSPSLLTRTVSPRMDSSLCGSSELVLS